MKFHFFFHVPFEGPGSMESWILKSGHTFTATKLWEKQPLPSFETLDILVVMGGPMNIYEEKEYPWLKEEKKFIEQAIKAGKKVLGICLGAQLIADVLGGKVFKNSQKEIGWLPVEWLPAAQKSSIFSHLPEAMTIFHWHGDTFHLPAGAVHLARTQACENQAFIYENRVIGLQFHLESTPESVKKLVENCGEELVKGTFIQSKEEILGNRDHYSKIQGALQGILEKMACVDSVVL